MSLPDLSARRPVGTAMLYFCVAVLGVVAARQLAVDLMPEVDMPQVSVTTTYTGVAPEEIESLITRPIEQALSTIEGIERLDSTSAEGLSRVQARFNWGRDLDEAINDIREKIDQVRGVLPEDADPPSIFKFNLSDMPVAFLGLSGDGDVRRLRYLADEVLSRRLERVQGVAAVDIRGGRVREIQVLLDPSRLSALGITPREVSQALSRENRNVSAGDMIETGREVLIRSVGEFENVSEIADTVVATRDGRPIFVHDLGPVEDTFRELTNELWIDGEPGMRMFVRKQSGANTVEVVDALKAEVALLNEEFGDRARLSVLYDSADFIRHSVNNVERGALYGALLAVIVLLVFLRDWRATIVIGTAIPISILATVALMYFNGYTLNVISLGGIALGVGMLVDSSIVVLENIHRKLKEGLPPLTAAIQGTREVSLAILAGTLTTTAVFVPVVFITGFAGVFFKEMAVVVSFALLCSLAVALTLIPAAAAKWLGGDHGPAHDPLRVLPRITATLRGLDRWYGRTLERLLHNPSRVILASITLLALSLALTPLIAFELMPESDEGRFGVSVELPVGTPVETTIGVMQELELKLRGELAEGELRHLITTAGPENWWRPASGNQGSMDVMLAPVSERDRGVEEIVQAVRDATADTPAAEIRIFPSSGNMMMRMMRGGGERLTVEIRGHELRTADSLAQSVVAMMETIPGVEHPRVSREDGQLERRLSYDRKRLAELGLVGSDVADSVEHYVLGRVATRFRQQGEEYDVRIQLAEDDRERFEQLPQLPIVTAGGQVVPLGSVARIAEHTGPSSISREDQQRMVRVTAGIGDREFGEVVADVQERLEGIEVPLGFTVSMGGELAEQQEAFTELIIGVSLALFLVFTVMAIQFESLVQPLIIMTSVPFALIGVILALAITGTTLNMNSFLGLIVLVGIVVNNAIVLIDYVNLLRREHGVPLLEAVLEGGQRRLRPILMTSLTTALGLLPLAIGLGEGSEIQAPLARVVVGGLLTSTLITLVFVPALYLVIERRKEREAPVVAVQRPAERPVGAGVVGVRR
ncbi:MAG TPA: efflux RND transporter permease subunit [Thermoanaerobaculia bacterium]|nr:efflux RND transporter permease subunit [Thermoanaerobaculia bacterium]